MRLRAKSFYYFSLPLLLWLVMDSSAFAATQKTATHAPSILDQAVNAFASLINVMAHLLHNYGAALIIVTIIIRLVTVPFMFKSLKNAKKMQLLQPQMADLKKRFGSEPRKYQEEVMSLYKQEGVSPFGGCMPMIVQFVVLTLFYRAIYTDTNLAHSSFLWLSLGKPDPTYILPILAAITSFYQQRLTMVQTDASQKIIQYIFPVMIFIFAWRTFSALPLYWVVSNLFTIVQLYFTHVKPSQKTEVASK